MIVQLPLGYEMQIAQQISFLNQACEYSSVDYSKETERKELRLEKEV